LQALRFFAYTKETLHDCPNEIYRLRRVKICYHLEDDTICIEEPKIENSGILQGKFLCRHRIPKNDIGQFWHWTDLNVGCDVMFYGRVFRIVDCDQFTKDYYVAEGVLMNEPEEMPKDPFLENRAWELGCMKKTCVATDLMERRSKKIIEFGTKSLKFHCVWDDRHTEYGHELRKYDLLFYLVSRNYLEYLVCFKPKCDYLIGG